MIQSRIDHIVITAPSLAAGTDYVHRTLGINPEPGGEHPLMGTHNALLRLGETTYLEVIAVNPNAPRPDRPRLFELDHLSNDGKTRLATWVMRTDDIRAAVSVTEIPLGNVVVLGRGQLNWLITIPADGCLPLQGVAPTLIQWLTDSHPAIQLQDSGCSLIRLEGYHPDAEKIRAMLEAVGFAGTFSVHPLDAKESPYLVAHIETPDGLRELSSAEK